MRFELGREECFTQVKFEQRKPHVLTNLYRPWVDRLIGITTIKLLCVEHHRVAWDQDPAGEKKYDGFVFRDAQGRAWHNQYPAASYGQLDDTNDRVVFLHYPDEEVFRHVDGELVRGDDGNAIIESQEKYDAWEDAFDNRYCLSTTMLGRVHRALNPLESIPNVPPKFEPAMREYLKQLEDSVEAASGKKVTYQALILRKQDGSSIVSPLKVAVLA